MRQPDQQVEGSISDILEACRRRLARGETIEGCLAAYPENAAELKNLLPLAVRAQSLAHEPDVEYSAEARRRFTLALAAAREDRARRQAARYRGPFGWLARLAVPAVLVLILSLSGLGLVQASDGSLPDSPLYTVKQASQNVGMLFARTPEGKAILNAKLANRHRLDLENAEKAHKGPMLRLVIARAMVEASDRATEQTMRLTGPSRAGVAKRLTSLLIVEQTDLNSLANDARIQVSNDGHGYQNQLATDIAKLTTP